MKADKKKPHEKTCKQCGRLLTLSNFKQYNSRSKGIREREVGYDTTCIECNKINAMLTRIDKKENKTEDDLLTLQEGKGYYEALVAKGLRPRGTYARRVLGEGTPRPRQSILLRSAMAEMTESLVDAQAATLRKLEEYLQETWCLEPEHYDEALDEIIDPVRARDRSVPEVYKELYDRCLKRWADYEDNYEWGEN